MEWLLGLDKHLLYFINGLNFPVLDAVMWQLSKTYTSIPLYLFFIYLFYKNDGKSFWKPLLAAIVVVVLADRISVELFKDVVCRLRPSHTEGVAENLHLFIRSNGSIYKGGLYGFVSSHAANTFGIATFVALYARRRGIAILVFTWAAVVSLSRVYLGVHYPTDIVAGGMLGALVGWLVYLAYRHVILRCAKLNHC